MSLNTILSVDIGIHNLGISVSQVCKETWEVEEIIWIDLINQDHCH